MRKKFPSLWLRKCVCWVQIRNGGEIFFYGQGKAKNLFGGVGQGRGQAHTAYIYNHNCYYDHNHCSVLSYCSNMASWIGKIRESYFFLPHHRPAVLTIFEEPGRAARVFHGEGPNGASIPGPDQFLFIFTFTFWSTKKQNKGSVRPWALFWALKKPPKE